MFRKVKKNPPYANRCTEVSVVTGLLQRRPVVMSAVRNVTKYVQMLTQVAMTASVATRNTENRSANNERSSRRTTQTTKCRNETNNGVNGANQKQARQLFHEELFAIPQQAVNNG
jgi:3'-phosphoadenosine 5'-phosphosulfate (PAPS) 3'-phosphatase